MEQMARLRLSPEALARELGGEILILDLRSSQYFGLTDVAARIWQLVERGGMTRAGLVAALTEEFDGDAGTIAADVDAFLDDLLERGLLVRDPA